MTMLILALVLSLTIGIVLGMLGGGGAILMLPMLVYAIGVEAKTAIAMSLFVVGATSVVGTSIHARTGTVRWTAGAIFGATAMAGAFAGGRLAHFIPASALLVLFGVVMVVTALAMLRDRKVAPGGEQNLRIGRILGIGAAVGFLSGLVGAGGGFLIVPALVLFAGLPMRESIGSSLFVITLQSFAGFAGHVTNVHIDWTLMFAIAGAAAAGSVLGARASSFVSPPRLRRAFAWLVMAMGLFMFAKQVPPIAAIAAGLVTMLAIFLTRPQIRSAAALTDGAVHHFDQHFPSQPPNPEPHPGSP
jgi:uncharacterized membrane protein YfcA